MPPGCFLTQERKQSHDSSRISGGQTSGEVCRGRHAKKRGEAGGGLKTAFYKTAIKLIPGENMVPLKCGIGWTSDGKGGNGMAILVGALAVAAVIITGKLTYRDMVRSD